MPFQLLDLEAVADYLHLTPAGHRAAGEEPRNSFLKSAATWSSFPRTKLTLGLHNASLDCRASSWRLSPGNHTFHPENPAAETILPEMLQAGVSPGHAVQDQGVRPARSGGAGGKDRASERPETLLASLEAREALCSTGVPGGFALPHPRAHDPYLFETSFIVVGRPVQEIHFGAPDGQPTHLFFLICCPDDRLHLHTLARICLIAQKTKVLDQLRDAPDAQTMRDALVAAEHEILADRRITS